MHAPEKPAHSRQVGFLHQQGFNPSQLVGRSCPACPPSDTFPRVSMGSRMQEIESGREFTSTEYFCEHGHHFFVRTTVLTETVVADDR